MRILAVDDDPFFRALFKKIPTLGLGAESTCECVESAEEALKLCHAELPDVLILDWSLPGKSGIETARELRAQHGEEPYILMCTGRSTSEDLDAALHAGADDYMTKPFTPADLRARLSIAATRVARARAARKSLAAAQRAERLEAIATLAYGVAHDFNNILGPIVAYSQMVQREFAEDDTNHRRLESVLRSCERGTNLVRQIMTYAAIDRMQVQPFTIETLAECFVARIAETTLPRPIHMRVAESDVTLSGSPHLLSEALLNVYSNALRAVQEVSDRVDISIGFSEREGRRFVCVKIDDDGAGIPADIRDRIFEPFFSTAERTKGTGMGLAVVDGVVRAHHGEIIVTTREDEGTSFEILLPLKTLTSGHTTTKPIVRTKEHA